MADNAKQPTEGAEAPVVNDPENQDLGGMADFRQYEKNTAFPIHATFDDDQVDKDSMKPGGFFTKKLYAEEL